MIRIFVLAFVFHHATALMDPTEFIEKIKPKCFDDAMPRKPSSGLTLGNFIYLVEKFEEKHPERNIETNIKTLLNEFSCEGLKYPLQKTGDTYYGKRETYAEERKDILDVFVKDDDIAKLEEDDFTDDEICNLFFSLSHTVYETEIKPRPERKPDKQTNTTDEIPIPNEQDQQEPVRVNVEDGVVSFGGDETRAISLSDVLFGILGALREEEKKINEFFPPHNRNPEFDDKVFQSSFLFSLSAKTAESVFHLPENIQPSAGYWISTDCSKNYILKTNTEMFTYATLIGSVDGYLMGKKLLGDKSRLPKLSQLLRMYYSKQGFSSFLSKLPLSFCQRGSEMEDETFKSELKSQVYNYVLYYNLKKKMHTTEMTKQKTEASMAKFRNEIPKALAQVNVERKKCGKLNEEVCETPSNVVVVLDKRNHFDTQLHTIAKLINNNGISENTFRVFVNAEDDVKIDMRKITDTVDANRIIASCALDEYNKDNDAGLLEENLVLQAINRTLMNIELELISLPGMPSKVVFYYNYGLVLENNAQLLRKIDDARRELINKHRGAEIYAIGENKEYLQKFVPSLNVIDSRNDNLLETLEQKICSAPAEFQYLECTVRSKMDQDFLLHINPNGVQYWQMQPKYFYKSFGYKLRFKPENGNIRVCFKRMKQFSKSDEGCQATTETKREIEFVNRDPCKGFDAVTCSPFYFGIYGVDDTSLTECTTERDNEQSSHKPLCKTLNQIKVTFNHEGLACSDAIRQIGSFYHYLLAIFAAFYIVNRKS